MQRRRLATIIALGLTVSAAPAGERLVISLRDMSTVELKSSGLELTQPISVHVRALGGGGEDTKGSRSDELFAYGWIINADTRDLVWKMSYGNTSRDRSEREFDGQVRLDRGSYEVYFAAPVFVYHTLFTHIKANVDHRDTPLFGSPRSQSKGIWSSIKKWFTDDLQESWDKRSKAWGIDLFVEEPAASSVKPFDPPKQPANVLFRAVGLGDDAFVRQGFSVKDAMTIRVNAIGEGVDEDECSDYGWIVNAKDRSRVWDMDPRACRNAGGAEKNVQWTGTVSLQKGDYILYYITDDSHSAADWNAAPPYDPLNFGVTLTADSDKEKALFQLVPTQEIQNPIVALTKVHDNENRSEGFTLKQDATVRIYAFGERGWESRTMADYGYIVDAKKRTKVWTMEVDRTYHGGGASKNRYVDELLPLQKGSYIVYYSSDGSHSYGDWNAPPPFDPDHYGITVMGWGDRFTPAIAGKYVEERDKSIVAQIQRVGNDAEREERFRLGKTTRIRIYAIGEGQSREMTDYGWIEDAKTGNVLWEMTYAMTFHAGGARKNRMVNTIILLDKGEYTLHYKTDDSHAYGSWNLDPPEDQQYYGITLYRDEGGESLPVPPVPPKAPLPED